MLVKSLPKPTSGPENTGATYWITSVTACDAQGARYATSGTSVMYTDTGVAGVGKAGIDSWLQYALKT